MAEVRGARLYVLAGPDLARSFALAEKSTVGRSDECDVVLRDRSISRKHALIMCQEERWFVQDLGSTNGVTKGGQRGERFELADGDEFRLGDLPLRFKLQAGDEAPDIEFAAGGTQTILSRAPSESDSAVPVAPEPEPKPAPAKPAPKPAAASEVEIEADEIEIEGPDEPLPQPRSASASATAFSPRPPRVERRTGFFVGDFEQYPFWLRGLLVLALLAVAAGLAYGAYLAVQMLRAGT
jgi:predicted component of type VI protein secretion system